MASPAFGCRFSRVADVKRRLVARRRSDGSISEQDCLYFLGVAADVQYAWIPAGA
jgi:hypothetical protein